MGIREINSIWTVTFWEKNVIDQGITTVTGNIRTNNGVTWQDRVFSDKAPTETKGVLSLLEQGISQPYFDPLAHPHSLNCRDVK